MRPPARASNNRHRSGALSAVEAFSKTFKPTEERPARGMSNYSDDPELEQELVNAEEQVLDHSLTEGSLWRAIWMMSWPLMLTTISSSISNMVDIQVAGHLGSAAQAAVGLSEQVLFLFLVFILSIGVGTTAIVSRAYGSGNLEDSIHACSQSLALAVIMGLTLSGAAVIMAQFALPIFSPTPGVMEQGKLFLSVIGLISIPFSIVSIINAAFRAIGDAKTPLTIVMTMTAVGVLGDYLTVLADWPVAGLGIRGIAFSSLTASTVGAILAIWRLSLSPLGPSLKRFFPLSFATIYRLVHIGLPSAFQRVSWIGGTFVLFFILSRCAHPTQALASWSIGMRIEAFLFMPLMALSLAVSSIVGQNLGAKQLRRAYKAGWRVTGLGIVLMLVLGTLLFIFAKPLAQFMSHDPKTVEYAISYLQINAIAEPFLALGIVLSGALQGAGDTKTPMWISIFCAWCIRLPLAWIFGLMLGLGPTGAWLAMAVSILFSGMLNTWRYQSLAWIKTRV